ncbi:MAG TPA: transcriptional repressor LexA [Rudaea sp.]|jgi:repressor LexA
MLPTAQQRAILAFIRERIDTDGMPPSQLEIAAEFGFKHNSTARYHLRALEQAGALTLAPAHPRGIRLGPPGQRRQRPEYLRLPVLGRVAGGAPIGNDGGDDAQMLVDSSCFAQTPDYFLRVQGDSMRDDGIFDGDLVAVKQTPTARIGQIVVARIDGELTIKRLKLIGARIALLPRNPDYAPIDVPDDADFAIEGIYCGLVRRS